MSRPNWKMLLTDITSGYLDKVAYSRVKQPVGQETIFEQTALPSVVLLPGFLNSDRAMRYLKAKLELWGFNVIGYHNCVGSVQKGVKAHYNLGWDSEVAQKIIDKTQQLKTQDSLPPILIGWSLGGVYALNTLKEVPECVSAVVSLGSPVKGFSQATSVKWLYNAVGNEAYQLDKIVREVNTEEVAGSSKVLSVCAREDGLVDYRVCCFSKENAFFVDAYHMSLMNNSSVINKIKTFLKQVSE